MNVAIHQPDYIPWLGYFYKIYLSDVFIHLDDVQFSKRAAHNFNVIKTPQGEFRLKFPVLNNYYSLINESVPNYSLKWTEKHCKTIEMNYSKAKYFNDTYPEIKELLMNEYENVALLNISLNEYIARKFGFKTKFCKSSDFNLQTKRENRIIDLCIAVGGTRYISGTGARVYQEEAHFSDKGVELCYLDYKPIKYKQLWNDFIPCMSVLDYIFNCGYDWEYVVSEVARLNTVQ